ncbi:MAG: helix-turn-helix transcriptional regulator [Nakamurella sp.]
MTIEHGHSLFWTDLAEDLKDPEFLREYVATSIQIATVDRILNELDDAREASGLSKAELARAISANPAAVRRLFSTSDANPTLGTLARVAAALGLRITVAPLDADDLSTITEPLRTGLATDPLALVAAATERQVAHA